MTSQRLPLVRLVVLTLLTLIVMSSLTQGRFLTVVNFESMTFQFPELGLLSFAMMLSMLSGGIDLSIVSIANLSGVTAAIVMTRLLAGDATTGHTIAVIGAGMFAGVCCGILCGSLNGVLIGIVGVSPILATLGTMQLFFGAAVVWTSGKAVIGLPEGLQQIGNGSLGGAPVPLLLFLVAAGGVAVLSNRTVLGVESRLTGSNGIASWFSAIPVRSVLVRTYLISGLIASVTGVLMVAHANSAKADYGSSYLLQSILVVVLGGISPSGGTGRVMGVSVAVIALQLFSSGFGMLHLSSFAKDMAWGGFLLVVMIADWLFSSRMRRT